MNLRSRPSLGSARLRRGVSLRIKTFLGVGIVSTVLVLIYLAFVDYTLTLSFQSLQRELTIQRVERMVFQVEQMAKVWAGYAKDNSERNDAYAFFEGKLPEFLSQNYSSSANAIGVQMVVAFDKSRREFARQLTDGSESEGFENIDIEAMGKGSFLSNDPVCGLMLVRGEAYLIAAHPVLRSDHTGPSPGWLAFFRRFDHEKVALLSELTGVPVSISPVYDRPSYSEVNLVHIDTREFGQVWASIVPAPHALPASDRVMKAMISFPSAVALGAVDFVVELPQRLFTTAKHIQERIRFYALVGAIIFLVVCLLAFEALVISKVVALDLDLQSVAESRDETRRVRVIGNDEIARVAETANSMLAALEAEHAKTEAEHDLLESVLHSVGEGVFALIPVREANGSACDFQVVSANAAAESLCNIDAARLIGGRLRRDEIFAVEAACFADYVTVLETGRPLIREVMSLDNDQKKWIRHSVTPWDEGIVVSFEDITRRKENEEALSDSLDELTRLSAAMMGREDRILELKHEVNLLCEQLNRPQIYGNPEICS